MNAPTFPLLPSFSQANSISHLKPEETYSSVFYWLCVDSEVNCECCVQVRAALSLLHVSICVLLLSSVLNFALSWTYPVNLNHVTLKKDKLKDFPPFCVPACPASTHTGASQVGFIHRRTSAGVTDNIETIAFHLNELASGLCWLCAMSDCDT